MPYPINSIAELHRLVGLPGPAHPLVSVINFETVKHFPGDQLQSVVLNFYSIWLKRNFNGKMKYGRQYYDFDEGLMSFYAPGQVLTSFVTEEMTHTGWWLIMHPDFLWNYPLAKTIREYGFFSYAVNEALHLSEQEETIITNIIRNIEQEYRGAIDRFSQNVIVSQFELLLHYADRFYHRQFITRNIANHDILNRMEQLLSDYFNNDKVQQGLPTVQYVAQELHVSPNYLSDLLRSLTGKSTQQHIQDKIIEQAKQQLSTTRLSISEIAYGLGFEHPQSFSKLFKNKTGISPVAFRHSFDL